MTTLPHRLIATLVLMSGLAIGACSSHSGHMMSEGAMAGDLMVSGAWSRATPPGVGVGAAFLALSNHGASADRLVGAQTPVAERVEIHESSMDGGVMKMRQQDAVAIAPGETVNLQPGGLHLMLMGLTQPLAEGQQFMLELEFEKSGKVELPVSVQALGSGGMAMDHSKH